MTTHSLLRSCCVVVLAWLLLPSASSLAQVKVGKRQRLKNVVQTVQQKVGGIFGVQGSNAFSVEKNFPLQGKQFDLARQQPKADEEAQSLSAKYAAIESVEERAYQIIIDLGLAEETKR
jgi:protein-disulfide isomerase